MDKVNFVTVDLVERLKDGYLYSACYRDNSKIEEIFVKFSFELGNFLLEKVEKRLSKMTKSNLSKEMIFDIMLDEYKQYNPEQFI